MRSRTMIPRPASAWTPRLVAGLVAVAVLSAGTARASTARDTAGKASPAPGRIAGPAIPLTTQLQAAKANAPLRLDGPGLPPGLVVFQDQDNQNNNNNNNNDILTQILVDELMFKLFVSINLQGKTPTPQAMEALTFEFIIDLELNGVLSPGQLQEVELLQFLLNQILIP